MIIDTLDNLSKYESLNPLFKDVVDFLANNDISSMENGKYQIKGAKGKTPDEAVLETHNKMIDIQIPLSASETFGYTPLVNLPEAEYNSEKDITKIPGLPAESYVTCHPGMFAVFFPQDGHAPCVSSEPEIRKAIFKVLA